MISNSLKRLVLWSKPPTILWIVLTAISVTLVAERLSPSRDSDEKSPIKQGASRSKATFSPDPLGSQSFAANTPSRRGGNRSNQEARLRPIPPPLPAVSLPEAQRAVLDLRNAYPHGDPEAETDLAAALSQLLTSATENVETTRNSLLRMLAMLPDTDYIDVVLPAIANPAIPGTLGSILYDDLSKRPDPIRLRTLFVIAGIESHPLAAAALSDLQSILKIDYQRDWLRWDQAISVRLVRDTRGARSNDCRSH